MNVRKILITGAEKGIGFGLAGEFFERGFHVTGTCDMIGEDVDLRAVGRADPDRLEIKLVDLADDNSLNALQDSLAEQIFDIIIYNTQVFHSHHPTSAHQDSQQIPGLFETTMGPVRLAKRFEKFLAFNRGMIVFINTYQTDSEGNMESAVKLYNARKAALSSLTRHLYSQLRGVGRAVLNIHAGHEKSGVRAIRGNFATKKEMGVDIKATADMIEKHYGSGELAYADFERNASIV